jgi:hypothetical protein
MTTPMASAPMQPSSSTTKRIPKPSATGQGGGDAQAGAAPGRAGGRGGAGADRGTGAAEAKSGRRRGMGAPVGRRTPPRAGACCRASAPARAAATFSGA